MTMRKVRARSLLALAGVVLLAACTGGARRRPAEEGKTFQPDAPPGIDVEPSTGGEIALSGRDLAPMDAYVRRRFWILGDDVEIVASKEYFVQTMSLAGRIGLVERTDTEGPEEAVSVLRFVGVPEALDVTTAPRAMIGTGITVTARRTLTVRFARTRSPEIPVRLRITATGKASLGQGSEVQRREPTILVGAQLRRQADGSYLLEER